jgi:DNA-binding transcriptional LysR family regulator
MNLRNVFLHHLRILAAVAEQGSITRAAGVLHLTQPTLSVQLKQLARAVGQPLFELEGRHLHITDVGHEVLAAARAIDDSLEALRERLAARQGLQEGRLRVAAVSTAEYFLPRLVGEFHRQYPGIEMALLVENRDAIVQRFSQNSDDLYVMTRPPEERSVRSEPLVRNPLVVVASPDHPWVGRRRIRAAELSAQSFVVRERGSGTRAWADAWLTARGVRLRASLELGSNEAVKQAVRGGFGIAVLSVHSLLLERAQGVIAILDVAGTPIRSSWHLVSQGGKQLGPVAEAFRRHARKAAPELARAIDAALA